MLIFPVLGIFDYIKDVTATMAAKIVLLFLVRISFLSIGSKAEDNGCPSPQYVSIGSEGVIKCSFRKGFYSLLWYNSPDIFHSEAVLTMVSSVKGGPGYLSGEFDVHPNGSLIMYNASLEDEATFTAIILETPTSDAIRFLVDVIIIAPTLSRLPLIVGCGNESRICFRVLPLHTKISCKIQDARPAIPLNWMVRTNSGDRNVSSIFSITNETHPFFTSIVTTSELFLYSSVLALLVCKADSPSRLLENDESLILLENGDEPLSPVASVIAHVERGSTLVLNCTDTNFSYFTWQVKKTLENTFSKILFAVFVEENLQSQIDDGDYSLQSEGTLVVDDVDIRHEGIYRCISSNGVEDDLLQYNVSVFVLPHHTYPAIDECEGQQYCVLEMEREGNLSCAVRGIRPQVQLKIIVSDDQSSTELLLYAQQITTQDNGDVFDVSVTSKYRLNDASKTRVTIECKVIGTDIEQLNLSTKLDILFLNSNTTTTEGSLTHNIETSTGRHPYWVIAVALIPVFFIVFLICSIVLFKVRNRLEATVYSIEVEEGTPMVKLDHYDEQKKLLKSELKTKYQSLYSGVQPVPFIKDLSFCVDNVFVDGGIEFLDKDKISIKDSWEKLDSYHDILCDPRVKSRRRILEGAPGYGKSLLCLQLAFEWCNQISSSQLKDIDIFILLSLSQLGGVKSIFAAIKQFLLQEDTLLTEELIQTILSNSSSILIVLDGFDEYPDQASDETSDIMSIIAGKMFQQFDVILTTRSSHIPKEYPVFTKRLRLRGFDNIARDQYIQKAVVSFDNEAAENVHERLRNNPILRDTCQVPFIFVMFSHLIYESKTFQTFQPVTCSFWYIISCFISHMKKKLTNENVQSYDAFEENHRTLHKLAFHGLISKARPIIWGKKYMSDKLGKKSYESYVRIGILVEEPINTSDDSNFKSLECTEYKTNVRFFHHLFCEWYAAHYLSEHRPIYDMTFYLSHKSVRLKETEAPIVAFMDDATITHYPNNVNVPEDYFQNLDPWDFHYFYRFASGLNFAVAKYTIEYLKNHNSTNTFITLCELEQYGKIKEGMQQVKEFCSTGPCIHKSYSLLLQRSTIELLEIASLNKITISSLNLRECYHSVDVAGTTRMQLLSGLAVPLLTSLKELTITETCRDFTPDEIADILHYSIRCRSLEKLWFWECVLPKCCHAEASIDLLSREFEVVWYPCINTISSPVYKLDLQKGLWKRDGELMTDEEYGEMIRKVRSFKQYNNDVTIVYLKP